MVLTNKSSITHVYAPPTALSQHSLTAGARLRLSSRDPVVFRVPTSQVRRSFRYHTQCSRMDSVLDPPPACPSLSTARRESPGLGAAGRGRLGFSKRGSGCVQKYGAAAESAKLKRDYYHDPLHHPLRFQKVGSGQMVVDGKV